MPTVLPPASPGLRRQPPLPLEDPDRSAGRRLLLPGVAPVVTISLGDTCTFRFAGVDRRTAPFLDIELRSGDLLVFGGPNRRIYHGVPKVVADTAPEGLDLPPGRLSITVRQTGLAP